MNSPPHRVWYDGACRFCCRQVAWLRRLDWRGRFHFQPSSELSVEDGRRLTPADLDRAIHCVAASGAVYRGARCLRFVGLRLPLLAPLAVCLYLPGLIQLADRVYDWVSRNRYRLGCGHSCSPPNAKSP
jgi:predicted DCC family thiol-disulfide oxidoreductase YuxK